MGGVVFPPALRQRPLPFPSPLLLSAQASVLELKQKIEKELVSGTAFPAFPPLPLPHLVPPHACFVSARAQEIPLDKQRLIFQGKVLKDDKLLKDYSEEGGGVGGC